MAKADEIEFVKYIEKNGDHLVNRHAEIISINDFINENILQAFLLFPLSKIVTDKNIFLDINTSDVIEFTRSRSYQEKTLSYGRLWAEFILCNEQNQSFRKDKWFEKKYNAYKQWIIRYFCLSDDKGYYIGPSAYALKKDEGYKMMSGPKYEVEFK